APVRDSGSVRLSRACATYRHDGRSPTRPARRRRRILGRSPTRCRGRVQPAPGGTATPGGRMPTARTPPPRYPLAFASAPSPGWWLLLLGLAAAAGLVAVAVGGPDRMRGRPNS